MHDDELLLERLLRTESVFNHLFTHSTSYSFNGGATLREVLMWHERTPEAEEPTWRLFALSVTVFSLQWMQKLSFLLQTKPA